MDATLLVLAGQTEVTLADKVNPRLIITVVLGSASHNFPSEMSAPVQLRNYIKTNLTCFLPAFLSERKESFMKKKKNSVTSL